MTCGAATSFVREALQAGSLLANVYDVPSTPKTSCITNYHASQTIMLPSEAEGLPYQNPVQGAGTLLSYANCHTEGVEELHLTTYLSQA